MASRSLISVQSFLWIYFLANCDLSTARASNNAMYTVGIYHNQVAESVRVDVYYESLCPDCIAEYPQLPPLLEKLGHRVDLYTYPYGNAQMIKHKNGQITVKCQHGKKECYGNQLHACAIDQLKVQKAYIDYNACLMASGSNDAAADSCGNSQGVDSTSIKRCAKGRRGLELLVHYGEESQRVSYSGVPYVLVNGKPKPDGQTLIQAVCNAFTTDRPNACSN